MEGTMRVSIGFDLATENWDEAAAYVVEAERLGSGVMQAGTRTPALVAMTAMSLASLSKDRFILGLGTSGPQVIEGWHGIPFRQPVQRMREIVEIVRIASTGERV